MWACSTLSSLVSQASEGLVPGAAKDARALLLCKPRGGECEAAARALQQAGLDQNKTNLEFSLRQNGAGAEREGGGTRTAQADVPQGTEEQQLPPASLNAYRGVIAPGGLNLWV